MNYVIYGAGHFGECFYHELMGQGENIIGWIDQKLVGNVKFDLPIFDETYDSTNVKIIIAVTPLVGSSRHKIKE